MRAIGIVLLIAGILALVYGGFSYKREKGDAKLGPVEIQVTEKKHVNVPVWAGIGAVVVGAAMIARSPRG